MGNEKSAPSGLKIEEIIKISDDWIQKAAILSNEMTKICVFEQYLKDDNVQTLQNLSKNLKLYRHPNILKYISSWRANKTLFVATEFGQPLSLLLQDLMPMQLCIGLFGVLKAITFLQEMASSSHNNISKDAVYVTSDGSWKLGRLELMTRKKYVREGQVANDSSELADQKGFAVLANEILQNITNDDVPAAEEFKQFCKSHVVSNIPNPQFFRQLFIHPFFTHQFLNIYNFLCELPAKNEIEKATFFKTLADDLALFPEEVVASLLGTLLLSRLVVLNSTAAEFLLPRIFIPKTDDNSSLFSMSVLQKYISPWLLSMFSIRDSQIRLILLRHFTSFHVIFTKQQLQSIILPELLVGIKDTNEVLISSTLRTLADLVPVLGASVVIGKGRAKLFADGRPLMKRENTKEVSLTSDLTSVISPLATTSFTLPERPSPDGGEDSTESVLGHDLLSIATEELKHEDITILDKDNKFNLDDKSHLIPEAKNSLPIVEVVNVEMPKIKVAPREMTYLPRKSAEEDLSTLDIKCSRSKNDAQFDDIELMFKDMEPVISKTAIVKVSDISVNAKNKFKVAEVEMDNFDGWGDEINSEWVNSEEE